MTTNKETFPFSTKKHCSVLFYWHSTNSHLTTDFYRKISACQPITAQCWPINSQLQVSSDAHGGMLWSGQHGALRDSMSFSPDHWTVAPAVHLEQQVFPTTGSSQIHLDCSRQAQTVNIPHLLSIYPLAQDHQQLSTAHFYMNYTAGTIKLSCEEPPIFSQFQQCCFICRRECIGSCWI